MVASGHTPGEASEVARTGQCPGTELEEGSGAARGRRPVQGSVGRMACKAVAGEGAT